MLTQRQLKTLYATAVVCVAFATLDSPVRAQAPGGTSPVYRLKPGDTNQLSVYKRFTSLIEHSANIKSVLDFDSDVIRIEVVQGNPQQVRVFALEPGVTTVTIQDEFDQYYKVEVLVKGDVRHLQSYIRRLYPDDDVQVEEVKGAVLLTGWVTEPSHIDEIVAISETFYSEVMNHMSIGGTQQVLLRCRILEVNRSKIRTFGMNFSFLSNNGYLISTPGPITPIQTLSASAAGPSATLTGLADSTLSWGLIGNGQIFQGFIQALREEGLLKIHSNPMVVAHNGQPANLLNGGETPVVVPGGLGTNAIEYKEFGVQMTAVPHLLGNGRVRLQVQPEVSERDFSNAVTVGGITVPAFTVRRASTEVEMNMGETLVIAGLISNREDAATSKVPFLGELPWIGAAFSRKRYTEAETELIILVTPDYTAPLSEEQIPYGGPGRFTDTPVDRELFFHGLLEVPKTGDECGFGTTCLECEQCRWQLWPTRMQGHPQPTRWHGQLWPSWLQGRLWYWKLWYWKPRYWELWHKWMYRRRTDSSERIRRWRNRADLHRCNSCQQWKASG